MIVAIVFGCFVYTANNTISAAALSNWPELIIESESTPWLLLAAAEHLLGLPGKILVGVAVSSAVLSGIMGFYMASSRLMYSMSKDGYLPAFYGKLDEKGIPKNVKYCIDYLNLDDADEAENYQTMPEDAGWTYVADLDKYLIFASKDGETPVPINTDWREEYRLMRKGLWRYEVPMGIIALALLVGLLVIPDITFDTIEQICIGIILWCAGGFGLIGLIYSFLFYWNSGRALKNDEPMKARGEKEARVWGIFHGAFGIVAGIGVLARYICVDYNHWMAGETGAVFFLSMTLIACVCSFLLSTPLHRWVSKRAYTMIDGIFFIIIAIGLFGYFIATQ